MTPTRKDGLDAPGLPRRALVWGWRLIAALALPSALLVAPALAGPVLDRVKARQALTCAAEERPGIAEAESEGTAHGLAVDLCRAIALAVLGPEGRITFTVLSADRDVAGLRDGRYDLALLSGGTMLGPGLADHLLPGPVAYVDEETLLVPEGSPVRSLRDLQGRSVCFMIGTGAQRALEAAVEREGVAIERSGYEEDVELRDAYNVGRCVAVAGQAGFLAEVRQDGGVHGLKSRLLPEPLAIDPLFIATSVEDARWAALVAWSFDALVAASAPRSGFSGEGAGPLARAVAPLGLRDGWLTEVTGRLGTYADMVRRNRGEGSDLRLAPGPNAPWPQGLLLVPASP